MKTKPLSTYQVQRASVPARQLIEDLHTIIEQFNTRIAQSKDYNHDTMINCTCIKNGDSVSNIFECCGQSLTLDIDKVQEGGIF